MYKHQNLCHKKLTSSIPNSFDNNFEAILASCNICLICSDWRSDTSKAGKPIDIHLVCLMQLTVYRNSDQKLG